MEILNWNMFIGCSFFKSLEYACLMLSMTWKNRLQTEFYLRGQDYNIPIQRIISYSSFVHITARILLILHKSSYFEI